ncbi:MAG: hypothetical protein Q9228_001464 [Teloschistes exilis]
MIIQITQVYKESPNKYPGIFEKRESWEVFVIAGVKAQLDAWATEKSIELVAWEPDEKRQRRREGHEGKENGGCAILHGVAEKACCDFLSLVQIWQTRSSKESGRKKQEEAGGTAEPGSGGLTG